MRKPHIKIIRQLHNLSQEPNHPYRPVYGSLKRRFHKDKGQFSHRQKGLLYPVSTVVLFILSPINGAFSVVRSVPIRPTAPFRARPTSRKRTSWSWSTERTREGKFTTIRGRRTTCWFWVRNYLFCVMILTLTLWKDLILLQLRGSSRVWHVWRKGSGRCPSLGI